jgi:hypothetical protein
MGQTVGPETSVFDLNQKTGNYPKKDDLNAVNHGESLKFNLSTVPALRVTYEAPVGGSETRNVRFVTELRAGVVRGIRV